MFFSSPLVYRPYSSPLTGVIGIQTMRSMLDAGLIVAYRIPIPAEIVIGGERLNRPTNAIAFANPLDVTPDQLNNIVPLEEVDAILRKWQEQMSSVWN